MSVGVVTCNVRLYTAVPAPSTLSPDILTHLQFQRNRLGSGYANDMQALFPEGYFFSYMLYGLTWVDVGLQSPAESTLRQQGLAEARWAYQHIHSDQGRAPFSASLTPPHGMFYEGWKNYLLTGILLLQPSDQLDTNELQAFQASAQTIADAISHSSTPFIPSYPGAAWPVDTLPAIVSLRGYTHLVDGRYEPTIANWLKKVQTLHDPKIGLLPHRTDYQTGHLLDGTRGTSQVLMLRFLAEIDPELAATQYQTFRDQFVVTRMGLPGILEFPKSRSGSGDIDSGPLLAGVSLSATAVFLGTARRFNDHELATAIWQGGEALGMAITTNKGRRYALGALPIGDAFVTWSKAATPWFVEQPERPYPPIIPGSWRLPYHLLSIGVLVFAKKLGEWMISTEKRKIVNGER
ncbi:MAG: hypothetical protein GY943_26700 [Chloroflexi bacterium]|nr:hypothetical protein [Chloroflexota bacterium]